MNYGKELILDLHECDVKTFTRKSIRKYFKELCILIDMKRDTLYWWDYLGIPEEEYSAIPAHLRGISAIQFITTSNITIHTLDLLKCVYINIFSCKEFNSLQAREFSEKWFDGKIVQNLKIERI